MDKITFPLLAALLLIHCVSASGADDDVYLFDNGNRDNVRAALRAVGNSGPRFGFVSAGGTTTLGKSLAKR